MDSGGAFARSLGSFLAGTSLVLPLRGVVGSRRCFSSTLPWSKLFLVLLPRSILLLQQHFYRLRIGALFVSCIGALNVSAPFSLSRDSFACARFREFSLITFEVVPAFGSRPDLLLLGSRGLSRVRTFFYVLSSDFGRGVG